MDGSARSSMFIAAACVAACSALVDLSGLQTDGGIEGGTDASIDVASESSVLGGSSRCALSSFSLCDDFERVAMMPSQWTYASSNSPTIDATKSARGTRSARFHFEGNDGGPQDSYLATSVPLLLPTRSAFVRAFVYVPSIAPVPNTGVLWLIGPAPDYAGAIFGFYQGKFRLIASTGTAPSLVSATSIPLDRWACVELEVFAVGDAGGGGAHAWLDDAQLDDLTMNTGVSIGTIDGAEVGLESVVTTGGFDMWIDEVAVDVNRIGCSR